MSDFKSPFKNELRKFEKLPTVSEMSAQQVELAIKAMGAAADVMLENAAQFNGQKLLKVEHDLEILIAKLAQLERVKK